MELFVIVQLVGLGLLLLLSAFFSGTEIALFSLSKLQQRRLRLQQPARGQLVSELLDQPQRLLSAILFGNTLVNVSAAIVGYNLLQHVTPRHADALAVPVMTALVLLVGEVMPKAIVIRRPETFAPLVAVVIHGIERCSRPLRRGFESVSETIVRRLEQWPYFAGRKARGPEPTPEEYRTLLSVGEQTGILRREERTMVNKILSLDHRQVREIMTPRVDMQCVEDTLTPDQMADVVRTIKHRRVPIIHETPDNVEGILNVKEFLINPHRELDEVVELPNFIPDTMSVGRLLKNFRKQEHPVAIVVDEYGGTQGMVTLEDILEEIVGEIEDEFDASEVLIQKLDDRRWLVNGKASLDIVNEQCGLNLQASGVETIAGWIIARLGTLPRGGEQVQTDAVRATVCKVVRRRVREILLERLD